jgi:DNA ligase-1
LPQDAVTLCVNGSEEKWKNAVYWVFDLPDLTDKPLEHRLNHLKELKEQGILPSFVKIVENEICRGKQHLKEYFEGILAKGGEGVVLREPQSLYVAGRSNSLRKFKPFFDSEVKVVENNYPHGFNCVQ